MYAAELKITDKDALGNVYISWFNKNTSNNWA